jgi:hypothetical protein
MTTPVGANPEDQRPEQAVSVAELRAWPGPEGDRQLLAEEQIFHREVAPAAEYRPKYPDG